MVAAGVSATCHAFLLTTIYHFAVFTAEQEECPENVSFDVHLFDNTVYTTSLINSVCPLISTLLRSVRSVDKNEEGDLCSCNGHLTSKTSCYQVAN